MTSHKHLEQQLKRPDSFQDTAMKLINYITQHPGRIAMMLAPIVIVAGIGYGVHFWQLHQSEKRRTEIAKILSMQTEEANSVSKRNDAIQKEIDALRAPAKSPGAIPATTEPALTPEALLKISDLEKKLADTKPDHSASTAAFQKFYENNKTNSEGWMAGMSWSSSLLEASKNDEARPIVEDIVNRSTANAFYQVQSRFVLAAILEQAGDYDAALKQADVLIPLVNDETKSMVLLLKGRLLYFKKDSATARTVLSEIVEKHGSTREAQTARSLLAELGPA